MTYHETIKSCTSSQWPAARMRSLTSALPLPAPRPVRGNGDEEEAATASRLRPSRCRTRHRSVAAVTVPRACPRTQVRPFHPAAISRAAKNSKAGSPGREGEDPHLPFHSPALLPCPVCVLFLLPCVALLILAGGWCLPHHL
jgi:hypothetical protein